MFLSTDQQLQLCQALLTPMSSRRVDTLLSSCLAAMRRELGRAGFNVSADALGLPSLAPGATGGVKRVGSLDAHELADVRGTRLRLYVKLEVDMSLRGTNEVTLCLSARAFGRAERFPGPAAQAFVNPMAVAAKDAQLLLSGSLNRMFGGEQVEASKTANMGRDFVQELALALVP